MMEKFDKERFLKEKSSFHFRYFIKFFIDLLEKGGILNLENSGAKPN